MPRHPQLAARTSWIGASVFEKYKGRLAAAGGRYVKLHIGDREGPLPYPTPFSPDWLAEHPQVPQYVNTFGVAPLRQAVLEKLRAENALDLHEGELMITAGASNALSVSAQAILEAGDEILILTPAWPFFFGMARLAGASLRELPLYDRLYSEPNLDLAGAIEAALTPQTVAIYLNTPNNPSGKVLSAAQIQAVAELAVRRKLWVISDEAYDGLLYDGREHLSIASLPAMRERTLTAFTCSKALAFAGIRLGWLCGPAAVVAAANKLMVHQFYGPNTPGQLIVAEALRTRAQWLPKLRSEYQAQRDVFVDALGLDLPLPEATYFVFFDARPHLRGRSFEQLVGECFDAGVSVTPGGDFGSDYREFLRLCYTADSSERALDAARRLERVLRGPGSSG
jgi:N-succinyldiaminopimelate aminotransferase